MRAPSAAASRGEAHAFAAFVLSGGLAAGVNVASRFVFSFWLIFEAAIVLAYLCGMTTAFLLNRYFVFERTGGSWRKEYARFALVNVFAFLQVLGVSELLVRLVFPAIGFTWRAEEVGHIIGVISPIVTSYYAHKHFSFGRKPSEPKS